MERKSTGPNLKRRKIVTGSLAAPVVLTVSSASAQSVTSLGKCLAPQAGQDPTPFFLTPEQYAAQTDIWYRVQVDLVKLKDGTTYADGLYFLNDNTAYLNVATLQPPPSSGTWLPEATSYKRWAIVWVTSNNGTRYPYVRFDRPTTAYQGASRSCYTSIHPTAGG